MLDSEQEREQGQYESPVVAETQQEEEPQSPIVVETGTTEEVPTEEAPTEEELAEAPPQLKSAPKPITLPVIRFPPFEQAGGRETTGAGDDMSDLFVVPREDVSDLAAVSEADIMGEDTEESLDDVFKVPEEEDMSDLLEVSEDDVMGRVPKAKRYKNTKRGRRATRQFPQPPSLGGVNY